MRLKFQDLCQLHGELYFYHHPEAKKPKSYTWAQLKIKKTNEKHKAKEPAISTLNITFRRSFIKSGINLIKNIPFDNQAVGSKTKKIFHLSGFFLF